MANHDRFQYLSYGEVLDVLAAIQHIDVGQQSAFSSRIKHLQKQGFPSGSNTGRGRAATYQIGQIVELALVLEFNQMGINPERAIAMFNENSRGLKNAVLLWLSNLGSGNAIWLFFDPLGLQSLMVPDAKLPTFTKVQHNDFAGITVALSKWSKSDVRRVSLINLSALLRTLSDVASERVQLEGASAAHASIEKWARS
ncbi:hypothetical protein ACT009_11530 [Sphingomonas sp. Tas61C01]|uniref:hypothetical protein n=1 Tax=Sphingomonas sp. Tas61C01 TaxID=3458297 RepID=UPI00403E7F3E